MRSDAPNWKKWKLYPGALFFLIPRLLFIIVAVLILAIGLRILIICQDMKRPITGCRKFLCHNFTKLMCGLVSAFGFFTYMGYDHLTLEQVNHYEEYLGSVETQ